MKLMTIVGTRPELIRLARIIDAFDRNFEHTLVHTGQNSDDNLKQVFFTDLRIRRPDIEFDITSKTLAEMLSKLFLRIEIEIRSVNPDAIVILGDTNSALSCILAKRMKIPFYHIEAGLRSFDPNVPEEINRRIIDHTADFNFVYTEHARRNLLEEGLKSRNIALVGTPLFEVINGNLQEIEDSKIVPRLGFSKGGFFLVSVHRQENVDDPVRLAKLVMNLEELTKSFNCPAIISTHPRTRDKLRVLGVQPSERLIFHSPFGFNDYCRLQLDAKLVLSDSGSISEEAAILKFRAITLRDSMERPEALEAGVVIMSGLNSNSLIETVNGVLTTPVTPNPPADYFIPDTSARIVSYIKSTIDQYRFWSGIR